MKKLLISVSFLGLALSVVPAFLVFKGFMSMQTNLVLLNVGMLLWFTTAIFWIKEDKTEG